MCTLPSTFSHLETFLVGDANIIRLFIHSHRSHAHNTYLDLQTYKTHIDDVNIWNEEEEENNNNI